MEIISRSKKYEVLMEDNLSFVKLMLEMPDSEIVIDENVYNLYYDEFEGIEKDRLFLLKAAEESKVVDTVLDICEKMTDIPARRNAVLISIGGGITQDITGFAANILYRGIKWIYVPTTLLAACDSCIGGKTSLNLNKYKNLLGTFYPPDEIHICPEFFDTLSEKDFKSGLGEVVKFNIMMGENGLGNMKHDLLKLLSKDKETIGRYVRTSLEYKKNFIEADEFDRGERIKLNFAHTFGHAIEVVSKYEIPHGTAVAIGMIMATNISEKRGLIEKGIREEIESVLLKIIDIDTELLKKPIEEYVAAIRKDKKQVDNRLTAVLITGYGLEGELSVVHDVTQDEIEDTVTYFIDLYQRVK